VETKAPARADPGLGPSEVRLNCKETDMNAGTATIKDIFSQGMSRG
jgi:hypothetical protein